MRLHVLMLPRRWPVAVFVGCAAIAAAAATFIVLDAVLTAHLHDGLFPATTRIYARPAVLYPGATMDRDRLERGLQRLGYRRVRRGDVEVGAYRLGFGSWVIGRRAFRHADLVEPAGVVTVRVRSGDRIREIRDGDGRLLTRLVLEPELLGAVSGGGAVHDRIPVRLSDVPDHLVAAVLAVEDRRFFEHQGLDPIRIAGAALANVRAGGVVQGASTITQQLVKNLFLSPRRTPLRKLREMAMAVVLELRHGKSEILEAYLNHVYLGQDRGLAIHGVGLAAQHYFGKDVGQLDVGEAALLAGLISAPNAYTPLRHPELATERRALVLRLMREQARISDSEYREAMAAPLALTSWPEGSDGARYFVDFVTEQLAQTYGRDLPDAGLAVFTTLDRELQQIGEDAVRGGLQRLEASPCRQPSSRSIPAAESFWP
jgi:penicillin-binding protein 1B